MERLSSFWTKLGARVETMDAAHHDLVLAVTSHLPHLIAYTIVGTASDLEAVTQSEVIKYSAGGFRDFTRIAASDPTMWRDVFLANKDAVLEMLQRFSEDLSALQRAIRWDDGDALFDLFTRTRAIRRSIIEQGQDDSRPDFGRLHDESTVAPAKAGAAGFVTHPTRACRCGPGLRRGDGYRWFSTLIAAWIRSSASARGRPGGSSSPKRKVITPGRGRPVRGMKRPLSIATGIAGNPSAR